MGRVLLALVTARPAGDRAGLDSRAENPEIRLGLPDEDATGGGADVRAVQTEADATKLLLYVRLGEVGIGVARARQGTFDAILDTAHQEAAIKSVRPWVCRENLLNRHVALLSL
jgi:hypothetical protein